MNSLDVGGMGTMSSGGMLGNNNTNNNNMPAFGLSVNPNQHYEMLKLHHMNLLNEIQETTLMMNLYQQQQLQQQQQQQGGGNNNMSRMNFGVSWFLWLLGFACFATMSPLCSYSHFS